MRARRWPRPGFAPLGRERRGGAAGSPGLLDSFNYAFEGIIHVLRTQRNMRIHVTVAVAVLVVAVTADVSKLELCALLVSIAFVLIAEMFNSALEGAIDVATSSFDPMAKLAKDTAAGAVLIAAINAVAVGYLDLVSGNRVQRQELLHFHAASTMKVPVMIATWVTIEDGGLSLDQPIAVRNEFRSIVDGSRYQLAAWK